MKIFKKTEDEFEYEIGTDTYHFQKNEEEDENEYHDLIRIYNVLLTLTTGGNKPRIYVKKYIENKNERDKFFTNLKPNEISDFTDWESY